MAVMFDARAADFRGIAETKKLYAIEFISTAFIDVNEDGSEAAAACKNIAILTIRIYIFILLILK